MEDWIKKGIDKGFEMAGDISESRREEMLKDLEGKDDEMANYVREKLTAQIK